MADRLGSGVEGLFFLMVGLVLLFKQRALVQSMLNNHNPILKFPGQKQKAETANRIVGNIIIAILGIITLIAGLLMLYSAATGSDWPFHYAGVVRDGGVV